MATADAQSDRRSPRPPGVYFEFVERAAPSARRRSDIAGFVGLTPEPPPDPAAKPSKDARPSRQTQDSAYGQQDAADGQHSAPSAQPAQVRRCDRLADFYDLLGKPQPDDSEPIAATSAPCKPAPLSVSQQQSYLEAAVRGFFANGGQTCFVAARTTPIEQRVIQPSELFSRFKGALKELGDVDAVSLLVIPGAADLPKEEREEIWREMILQAETLRDRVALIDPPRNFNPQLDVLPVQAPSGFAAIYWPWLKVADRRPDVRTRGAAAREVPPCGHIAGTIARRDLTRGVFAPPANMAIEEALGVTDELTPEARELVNEKKGINVIVATPGRGVRAMGARTVLADVNDPYTWLNVRRLIAHLAEWIDEDTQWTVFEPQGDVLYRAIERTVRTILFDLWRRGGLVGATDDEAYFVRCDATTNPPDEAELGRVICLVGVRPPVPAEMIFVRIGIAEGRVELMDREFADA